MKKKLKKRKILYLLGTFFFGFFLCGNIYAADLGDANIYFSSGKYWLQCATNNYAYSVGSTPGGGEFWPLANNSNSGGSSCMGTTYTGNGGTPGTGGRQLLNSDWGAVPTTDGDWYFNIYSDFPGTSLLGSYHLNRLGGVWTLLSPVFDTTTRIISMTPEDGTTTPSGVPVDFSLHAYISSEDVGRFVSVLVTFTNVDQNVVIINGPGTRNFQVDVPISTGGDFYYATSTILGDGNYRVHAQLMKSFLFVKEPWTTIDADHLFIVGIASLVGNIQQSAWSDINNYFASTTATSTASLAGSCAPWFGMWDTVNCMAFLWVPDSKSLDNVLKNTYDNFLTRFPIGYITDFVEIMATTTEGTLFGLHITIPNALPGGGAHADLSFSHVLDPLLNATSGAFMSPEASSTETFYEITERYWEIIVSLMVIFYFLYRIFGAVLIPQLFYMHDIQNDRPSDKFSHAERERYRYKEKLYNMSRRK